MSAGIDYGMGTTNMDHETGIRFGVIPSNDIMPEAFDDIASNGDDVDFEAHKDAVKVSLEAAIEAVLNEYNHERSNSSGDMAEDLVDNLEWDGYEGTGDCTRYVYEADGYKLQTCSDGDIFVLKSKFYTFAPFCSPCAPGAGYLRDASDDEMCSKTYCLNSDWFSDEFPCPYPVYEVETGTCIYKPKEDA
jgi:hypothetical protein